MEGRARLLEVLARARDRGFLGPGDPADHLDHASGFVDVARRELAAEPARVVDLGTGGGVPGLALAVAFVVAEVELIESSSRRAEFLAGAVADLGLGVRVRVVEARAEDVAHDAGYRERFDLVTARSFAPPPVTAEIATGFARVGGIVVVSEPPEQRDRWPSEGLVTLGFGPARLVEPRIGAHFAVLPKVRPTNAEIPRRRGRAAKRPRW